MDVRLSESAKLFLYEEYFEINGSSVHDWKRGHVASRTAALSQVVDRIVTWYDSNYPPGFAPSRLIVGVGALAYRSTMRISGASARTLARVGAEFDESPLERIILTWIVDRNRRKGTGAGVR